MKLNTDFGVFRDKGLGLGAIVRDNEGKVMMAVVVWELGVLSLLEGEAHSINLMVTLGIKDSLNLSMSGLLFDDMRALFKSFNNISFIHCYRKANEPTHYNFF